MPRNLSDVSPAALVKEYLRLQTTIEAREKSLREDREESDRILAALTPAFGDDFPRYFHGDYNQTIIRIDWYDGLLIEEIDLEWLHAVEFPRGSDSPCQAVAAEAVTAHESHD